MTFEARLNATQVAEIRALLEEKVAVAEIARRYKVSRGVVGDIKTGVYRTSAERYRKK